MSNESNLINSYEEFGFFKGYTFVFCEGNNIIKAWFSCLSGLEKVYVNDSLVSEQRNYKTDSENTFNVGKDTYASKFSTESILKGPFVCDLHKNGQLIKRQKLIFPATKKTRFKGIYGFLFCILLGVIFGFSMAFFKLPTWSVYVFLVFIFIISFSFNMSGSNKPHIEEEICN